MTMLAITFLIIIVVASSRKKSDTKALPAPPAPPQDLRTRLEAMTVEQWQVFRAKERLAMARKRNERLTKELHACQHAVLVASVDAMLGCVRDRDENGPYLD